MEYAGEQVIDLLAAINTLLSGWHDWYGFDVDRQAVRGYEKLFERGYATRQSRRANSKVNDCVKGGILMDALLTIREASRLLGVSVGVMRRLVWSNSIDYIDLNKGGKYIHARFTQ